MKTTRKTSIISLLVCIFFLVTAFTNDAKSQCTEFTLTELEKLCTLEFKEFKEFIAKKGFGISKLFDNEDTEFDISCVNKGAINFMSVKLLNHIGLISIPVAYYERLKGSFVKNGYKAKASEGFFKNENFTVFVEYNQTKKNYSLLISKDASTTTSGSVKQSEYFSIAELESVFSRFLSNEYISNLESTLNAKGYYSSKKKFNSDLNSFYDDNRNEFFFSKDVDNFIDNYMSYTIIKPSKQLLADFKIQLKSYNKYTFEKKDTYFNDGSYKIKYNYNNDSLELIFWDNSKKNQLLPAVQINDSILQVNSYTQFTEIFVKKGDKVFLKANGKIGLGMWAGEATPNGIEGFQNYSEVADLKHGSLIGKIGKDGKWFLVGRYNSTIAEENGRLFLQVNDKDPSNNSGSFIVEYGINKEIPPPPIVEEPKVEVKPTVDNSPKPILEDYFADNKNNWTASSNTHVISIGDNRMIYENKEKKDKIYATVKTPIALSNDDNYTVEISIQSLTPCQNQKVGDLAIIFSKKPLEVFYGFSIGNGQSDIAFAVGSQINEKTTKDFTNYTCKPSYFISNTIAGSSSYLQNFTKNNSVADGGNVNILKLVKKEGKFSFYINNRLVSNKNSFSLGNDNSLSIVTSAKSKVSVNYVKVYKIN